MTTLAELGLKEIVHENPGDFSALLYLTEGVCLAHVIRREPPLSIESIAGTKLVNRDDLPETVTDQQYARAVHWHDCLRASNEAHFALVGKQPHKINESWTVFS